MLAGEVKETNEAGDGRLVDDITIPDILNGVVGGITGIVGSIPGIGGLIPGINGGGTPGNSGGIPGISGGFPGGSGGIPGFSGGFPGSSGGIPGFSGGIPGFSGGIPGNSGGFPGISGFFGGGYPGQGAYRRGPGCPYGCCDWALQGGYCTSCCTIWGFDPQIRHCSSTFFLFSFSFNQSNKFYLNMK